MYPSVGETIEHSHWKELISVLVQGLRLPFSSGLGYMVSADDGLRASFFIIYKIVKLIDRGESISLIIQLCQKPLDSLNV